MANKFYNILVPVDFTKKNQWAIAKAIELANHIRCNIHLVHIVSKPLFRFLPFETTSSMPYDTSFDLTKGREKLVALRDQYREHLCEGCEIEISIIQGRPQKELSNYINQYSMDLVVMGLSKFNFVQRLLSSLSISSLARKTNIPVLAVRSSGLVSHFKKIVLPLNEQIPIRRIKLAAMLARQFKSTVYLVSLRKDISGENNVLDKTLEVIQSLSTIPVQCFMLEGKNLAQSTLEFSKRINADLIMINPIKEFRLPGLWNKITKKLLSYESKIPVLTVEQGAGDNK
jgi:nucleotide-binding universal stress UspA family protein